MTLALGHESIRRFGSLSIEGQNSRRLVLAQFMTILVDYDNLTETQRRLGLSLVAERILDRISKSKVMLGNNAHFRLYGGWYEGPNLSRRAQSLSAEIQRDFPKMISVGSGSVHVTTELALSLDVDPTTHFHHTFRKQSPPLDVRCHDPKLRGCTAGSCAILPTQQFLGSGKCPEPSCGLRVEDLLFRSSQKLVDTMLTADLLSVANREIEPIAVVSSDDDLWPGLYGVLCTGHAAVQIHTRPGGIARNPYPRLGQAGYFAIELS